MAQTPIISLNDIALTFGGEPVLDGVSVTIQEGDRIALVGRNGSGKSTLMKVLGGLVEPDRGTRVLGPGFNVAMLEQDPETKGFETLGAFAQHGVDPSAWYLVEQAMEGLKLAPEIPMDGASGGQIRRAALARLMAADAEALLLDEPTNHLDIDGILWLEAHLKASGKTFVLISHDRAFLSALTTRMIWVDRGELRSNPRGFSAFERWRDETYEQEDLARHKQDRLIKAEQKWSVEGISARRTRDMGRVRRLREMKSNRAAQRQRVAAADLQIGEAGQSGKLVVDAKNVSLSFDQTVIAKDFSIRVMRGDRLAFVGPNGVGKTTLVKLLTGAIAPDGGTVKLGLGLEPLFFEQTRDSLDPDASLWDTLTGDKELGVSGNNDQIMVRGAPRHVAGYLRDFLFEDVQMRGPVRALSGGEKARLIMARNLARPCNLMVMDEPTNDLDVETLELLETGLAGFEGTVVLISHDRDFVDRIAERTIVMAPGGRIEVHAGGYSDVLARGGSVAGSAAPKTRSKQAKSQAREDAAATNQAEPVGTSLSFTQSHRLETLPDEIAKLEREIAKLESYLARDDVFTSEAVKAAKASAALAERQKLLADYEMEWLELAELAEKS